MLEIRGIDKAVQKLRGYARKMEGTAAASYRRFLRQIFTDAVEGSPQWSGNLASQWYIEFGSVKGSYSPIPEYVEPVHSPYLQDPYQMGDDPAVRETLARELPKLDKIRYNTKVTIKNYAPYASDVEAGDGPNGRPIREVNQLAAFGGVAMVGYLELKYSNARRLKGLVR